MQRHEISVLCKVYASLRAWTVTSYAENVMEKMEHPSYRVGGPRRIKVGCKLTAGKPQRLGTVPSAGACRNMQRGPRGRGVFKSNVVELSVAAVVGRIALVFASRRAISAIVVRALCAACISAQRNRSESPSIPISSPPLPPPKGESNPPQRSPPPPPSSACTFPLTVVAAARLTLGLGFGCLG